MPAFNEISAQNLNRLVGTPDAPLILDLRIQEDFEDDPRMIPASIRWDFQSLDTLRTMLDHCGVSNLVIVCQKGRKISHGAAAVLRSYGFTAEVLSGGQFAWRDAGFPMVNKTCLDTQLSTDKPTRWVTKHRPKIDRIACPWLIRRFIDPKAEFLFVPRQDVELVAEKFKAIPFDIVGVEFTHRSELCTFDALLKDFGLSSPVLNQMATIVRGADTNVHQLAPQAAGLLAFSVGLSRMYKNDLEQLEAGMLLYDALFRWARDGQDEGHTWPAKGESQ